MKLRTDTIGHFENPTEVNICDAVIYSGEGAQENDLVKLMIDEEHFVSIWIGQRSDGHTLILRSGPWKSECTEKLSSERVVDLMVKYLHKYLLTFYKVINTLNLITFMAKIEALEARGQTGKGANLSLFGSALTACVAGSQKG